jgi:actin-related protein 2
MVFLGGAVLANIVGDTAFIVCATTNWMAQMADKENMWISKQEWEEQGARALDKLGAR